MDGIDEVETQMDPNTMVPDAKTAANASSSLHASGVLISAVPKSSPLNDYDALWMVHAHPSVFPYGTGGCPNGMSFIKWFRGLINRYPCQQYAQNVGMLTDGFNIWQRHEAYKQASVVVRTAPHMAACINSLTQEEVRERGYLRVRGKK